MTDRLDSLLSELPTEHPVPPGLDAATLARARTGAPASSARGPRARRPWLLAASLLLGTLLGGAAVAVLRPAPALVLAQGSQLVTGSARVLAGDRVVRVDGRALLSVEPGLDLLREEGQEADTMKSTHLAAALAGSLVTVAVYEGRAVISGGEGEPVVVTEGQRRAVGPGPAAARSPGPTVVRVAVPQDADSGGVAGMSAAEAQAVIAALEEEVAGLRARHALAEGQLAAERGDPQPWPEDVPEAFLPANFERSMRSLVEAQGAGELLALDCSEFPCLTVLKPGAYAGQGTPPEVQAVIDGMMALLGDAGVSVHNSKTGDGEDDLLLTGLGFTPGGRADHDAQTRANYRMEGHLRGLTEELLGEGPGDEGSADEDVDIQ